MIVKQGQVDNLHDAEMVELLLGFQNLSVV